MKKGNTELQQVEIESCFLDSLVKFAMIGIEAFDGGGLSDKPGEFAIERYEMSCLYFL